MEKIPIGIRFKSNSQPYIFFQFVVMLFNNICFDSRFNHEANKTSFFKNFDFDRWNNLQEKFNNSIDDNDSLVSISTDQIKLLISCIDHICKVLLSDNKQILDSILLANEMLLDKDWDKDFFKSADYIFTTFKEKFSRLPNFNSVMESITEGKYRV